MKKCSLCGEMKDENRFPFRNKSKSIYRKDCQDCHNKRYVEWKQKNPEKSKKIWQTFHKKHLGKNCLYCKKWFKPEGDRDYCTKECNLLGKIRKKKNGCWEWKASRTEFGYGKCSLNAKTISAHRLSYLVFKGEIFEKLFVLHKCDNPRCINPDHLYLGDQKQNIKDMDLRGRRNIGKKK